MRHFNTAGPCLPELHYMLPPQPRLPQARGLVEQGLYFVVHAPRQTGKTTTLAALARQLTAEGAHAALRFSCETAEPAGDDIAAAEANVLYAMASAAEQFLPPQLRAPVPRPPAPAGSQLKAAVRGWAARCPLPLVLFFDEIDAVRGESLRSVLRQLRDGYTERPAPFAYSVALCGLRDVRDVRYVRDYRDYEAASGDDPTGLGTSSPFNIKVASVRMGDFTEAQVRALYGRHTAETGQPFTDEALARAWQHTAGQPWLVNALAREVLDEMGVPVPEPVTAEHIDEARERLILARATHLDSITTRLGEPRVRRVLEPLIAGELAVGDQTYDEDVAYLRDLGLLAEGRPARIANPIYREVIVRVLGSGTEENIADDPRSFVLPVGRLDFDRLLHEFAAFWRQHGEVLVTAGGYHDVAPQLVIMAYLHRIINGKGYIDRDYGIGRGRIDILIRWPYWDGAGKRAWQHEAIELKVWRDGEPDPMPQGLEQLDGYLEQLGLDHGTLVVFDRRPSLRAPAGRARFLDECTPTGRKVVLLRA